MSQETYIKNIIKMSIMWSAICFTSYLLHFQLKYLEGDLFTNNNVIALTDFIACATGGYIYQKFGLKITYYLSIIIGIVGGLCIMYLENMHEI